jgi:metal-responsive CopG/Arc/MetJ family transcriptional regulator
MKHNLSITLDQKLFRELENIRGREKRSTFIEHLIVLGLHNYAYINQKKTLKTAASTVTLLPQTTAVLNREPAMS